MFWDHGEVKEKSGKMKVEKSGHPVYGKTCDLRPACSLP